MAFENSIRSVKFSREIPTPELMDVAGLPFGTIVNWADNDIQPNYCMLCYGGLKHHVLVSLHFPGATYSVPKKACKLRVVGWARSLTIDLHK